MSTRTLNVHKRCDNLYKLNIPFCTIYFYIKIMSTYQLRCTIKTEFNASVDDYNNCYFNNKEDILRMIDWINSLLLYNKMTDETQEVYPIFEVKFVDGL